MNSEELKTYRVDWGWYVAGIFPLIAIDRFTKNIFRSIVDDYHFIFSSNPVLNKGFALGFLEEYETTSLVPFVSCLFIIFLIINFFYLYRKGLSCIPHVFIIAGSLSNLFDRLWYGGVFDFISFNFGFSPFSPLANVADLFIVFGILSLLFVQYRSIYQTNTIQEDLSQKKIDHPEDDE